MNIFASYCKCTLCIFSTIILVASSRLCTTSFSLVLDIFTLVSIFWFELSTFVLFSSFFSSSSSFSFFFLFLLLLLFLLFLFLFLFYHYYHLYSVFLYFGCCQHAIVFTVVIIRRKRVLRVIFEIIIIIIIIRKINLIPF